MSRADDAADSLAPQLVRDHLEQLLPLDGTRRAESGAWFALVVLVRRDGPPRAAAPRSTP